MNFRMLALGASLGFLFAVVPSCGGGEKCGPSNCNSGCCDSDGKCVATVGDKACGASGNACVDCSAQSQTCVSGACVSASNSDGGNNNNLPDGCGPGTKNPCATGCCNGTGAAAICLP